MNTPKLIATKRLYKNSINIESIKHDLESYKKSLELKNYKDLSLHLAEIKIIENRLKQLQ